MKQTRIKVIYAGCKYDNGVSEDVEGEVFEGKVNTFCEGREIVSIQFEFNPAINRRHLAYIVYNA